MLYLSESLRRFLRFAALACCTCRYAYEPPVAIKIVTRAALPRFEARTADSWAPERRQPASCAEAGAMVRLSPHCLSGISKP